MNRRAKRRYKKAQRGGNIGLKRSTYLNVKFFCNICYVFVTLEGVLHHVSNDKLEANEREITVNETELVLILENYKVIPDKITSLRKAEKLLMKIKNAEENTFYLKGEKGDSEYVERCCEYADYLKHEGFPVASYTRNTLGCFTYLKDNMVFTLEEEIEGVEVQTLTDEHLNSIAKMLGVQHQLSNQSNRSINQATSWSLFGGNATEDIGDYDENERAFWQMRDTCKSDPIFQRIEELYIQRRDHLKRIWFSLPSGPVQGDFCYYNMVFTESASLKGCFDFNLAGDEIYINELVSVAIYHCWHVPYSGQKTEIERFWSFMRHYEKERTITPKERSILSDLFAIIRAFRYDRVEEGLTLQGEQRNDFLRETMNILESHLHYEK